MPMKIDGYDAPAGQRANSQPVSRTAAESSRATPGAGPAANRTDTLEITAEAQRLRENEARLRDLLVIDSARVDRIRAAIADGSYQIDAASIASKLARFDAALPDA